MLIRKRLLPFRILIYLMCGQYKWLTYRDDGSLVIHVGGSSRFFGCSTERMREHLKWLSNNQYIEIVDWGRRDIIVRIPIPANLLKQLSIPLEAETEARQLLAKIRGLLNDSSQVGSN